MKVTTKTFMLMQWSLIKWGQLKNFRYYFKRNIDGVLLVAAIRLQGVHHRKIMLKASVWKTMNQYRPRLPSV
jgi:hypothetical protein